MEEREDEASSIRDADIHVCIFPHLDEFVVLDVRDMENPRFRAVPAKEMLTPVYYQEVRKEFSRLLQSGESPFLNLITLPERLETYLRTKGMQALTHLVESGGPGAEERRLSIFLCAGPITSMSDDDITSSLEAFFQGRLPAPFVQDYGDTFRRLLAQERASIKARQQEELRRAVLGRSSQFYTLWQSPPGPQLN